MREFLIITSRQVDKMSVILFKLVLGDVMNKLVIIGNISTKIVQFNAYEESLFKISGNVRLLEQALQEFKIQHKKQDR